MYETNREIEKVLELDCELNKDYEYLKLIRNS